MNNYKTEMAAILAKQILANVTHPDPLTAAEYLTVLRRFEDDVSKGDMTKLVRLVTQKLRP